jgi:hypothetical protein
MEPSEIATYLFLGLAAFAMIYYIKQLRERNLVAAQAENAPKIAGEDELGGQALDPEQFAEPDDDALDEMEDLLKGAAESQGLEYEED